MRALVGRERGRYIFDEVAALYDEARPHYPAQLLEDIISLSGIPPGGRILEIGSGTGKATAPFARLGYSMLCVEPGPNLAAVARGRFGEYPNVQIEVISFEDWRLEENAFDLVIAADCWHWIAPEVGYSKSAQALKDTGALAVFRNSCPRVESGFFYELEEAYEKHAPELADNAPTRPVNDAVDCREQEMNQTGLFEEVIVRRYPWYAQYDPDSYIKLMKTYSDHRALPDAAREALFDAVRELIERHGGTLTKSYLAVLHLAKKRRD